MKVRKCYDERGMVSGHNEEVGKLFGGLHYSAVSKTSSRLREDMAKDKKLSKIIQSIDSHFKT
jgi:hypothetical protein